MRDLRFVVFSDQEEIAEIVCQRLEDTGRATVVHVVSEASAIERALKQHRANAIFVEFGRTPHLVFDALQTIPEPRPMLIGAGPSDDPTLLLRAMKLGLREYLSPACGPDEVREAVRGLVTTEAPEAPAARGEVIAVMGSKGGVGATFVVTQLAASLQAAGQRTAIVDLNYPLGDVAVQLDLNPKHTLADLGGEDGELDAVFLRTLMARHRTGCCVLASPKSLEEAEVQTRDRTDQVLELLRREFDWVIVDVSRSWNDPSAQALERADQILLVTLLEVTTLNHAKQHIDLLSRLGFGDGRVRVLANRFSKADPVTEKDCEAFIGRPLDARIPNDYATSAACVNQGLSVSEVAPAGALDRAFVDFARDLSGWCGRAFAGQPRGAGLSNRLRRLIGR